MTEPQPRAADMWDARFAGEDYFYGTLPNDFLVAEAHRFGPGARVLLLGEGEGRNAVFLASRGCVVTAVDASAVGLGKAQRLAERAGVTITTLVVDLNEWSIPAGAWDGIVSIWCHLPPSLRARVHREVVTGLADGGTYLLEAYHPRQLALRTGGPSDVRLLVTADLLRSELAGLTFERVEELERVVAEGTGHRGPSAVVQLVAPRHRRDS